MDNPGSPIRPEASGGHPWPDSWKPQLGTAGGYSDSALLWTAVAHAVLFAFYHVWTLWLTPTRILAVLPLAYITLRTRSILPAIVAHIVLNLIDVVVIIAFVIRPS